MKINDFLVLQNILRYLGYLNVMCIFCVSNFTIFCINQVLCTVNSLFYSSILFILYLCCFASNHKNIKSQMQVFYPSFKQLTSVPKLLKWDILEMCLTRFNTGNSSSCLIRNLQYSILTMHNVLLSLQGTGIQPMFCYMDQEYLRLPWRSLWIREVDQTMTKHQFLLTKISTCTVYMSI